MADQKRPPFNGNEGEFVSRQEAGACTKKYRGSSAFQALDKKKAMYTGGRKILRLLSQENAVGLRSYFGLNDAKEPQLFIVAVDTAGNDILGADMEGGEDLILDRSFPCPPICPDTNDLNS